MVKMEDEDDEYEEPHDFVETLKDLMRSWRWPEWHIDQELPKFLKVCEGVGIVKDPRGSFATKKALSSHGFTWHAMEVPFAFLSVQERDGRFEVQVKDWLRVERGIEVEGSLAGTREARSTCANRKRVKV